ncbi:MAG: 3-isopropylmalate dehydratase [Candidatus Omnitrophica bacterium]|nr:3-isopropylmalate dehydratase [Candidatus Omnitrophota bacterium]
MQKNIRGKVYVLGNDIDTDQIIPAQYLTYNPANPEERKMFGKFALAGIPEGHQGLPQGNIPFVREGQMQSEYKIIVAGKNFGCGSSREHAPLAIREAGVEVIIAEFYARIFFRNSVNGGYLIPYESQEHLAKIFNTGEEAEVHIGQNRLINHTTGKSYALKSLGEILPILEAGDVFQYAKKNGIIS